MHAGQAVYLAGFAAFYVIRLHYMRKTRGRRIRERRSGMREQLVLTYAAVALFILPLVQIFTRALAFADYASPPWSLWAGALCFAASALLFWRSHADLGRNWSATLEIGEGHELVTSGVYAHVRHPMYSSILLYGLAQALLTGNWLTALAGLLSAVVFPLVRMPAEEKMMAEHFGARWEAYKSRTGALLPRF